MQCGTCGPVLLGGLTVDGHLFPLLAETVECQSLSCSSFFPLALSGFGRSNASIGTILHQLGPDCASSNVQAIQAIIHRCRFGYSEDHAEDTSYIRSTPIDENDLRGLVAVRTLYQT